MTKKKPRSEAWLKEADAVKGGLTIEWLVGSFSYSESIEKSMRLILKIRCVIIAGF